MTQEARDARAAYMREYRKRNKDKLNAYARQWRKENPEKVASYTERQWEKRAKENNSQ